MTERHFGKELEASFLDLDGEIRPIHQLGKTRRVLDGYVTRAEAETMVAAERDRLSGPIWRLILRDEHCIDHPCDEPNCECRQKLARIMTYTKDTDHD